MKDELDLLNEEELRVTQYLAREENEELTRLADPTRWTWDDGIAYLKIWMDTWYPKEHFDGSPGDPGPDPAGERRSRDAATGSVVAVRHALWRLEIDTAPPGFADEDALDAALAQGEADE